MMNILAHPFIFFLIFIFLALFPNNVAFATLQDQYNQVLQKPNYTCHNGACLPTGHVQGNNLIDPITHLPSCVGSGCNGELNPCEGRGYGGVCDEALAGNQGSIDQTVQPLKNFCANGVWNGGVCLEDAVRVGDIVYISAAASGGFAPYSFKLFLDHSTYATDLSSQLTINENIATYKFYPNVIGRYDFSFDVIDSTGQQLYNFTEVNVIDSQIVPSTFAYLGNVGTESTYSQAHESQNAGQSAGEDVYQTTGQIATHQTSPDNPFWLDLIVGLGVSICVAVVGIVTLKFWAAVRIHAQQRERQRQNNRSAIRDNSENVETQVEREPFFTDEWFRNLQEQFPRDYARILDWVKRNPDETKKIRQASETEREEQRRIVRAWKDEVKSIKCACGATFSDEDKFISHLKKTGHKGL